MDLLHALMQHCQNTCSVVNSLSIRQRIEALLHILYQFDNGTRRFFHFHYQFDNRSRRFFQFSICFTIFFIVRAEDSNVFAGGFLSFYNNLYYKYELTLMNCHKLNPFNSSLQKLSFKTNKYYHQLAINFNQKFRQFVIYLLYFNNKSLNILSK